MVNPHRTDQVFGVRAVSVSSVSSYSKAVRQVREAAPVIPVTFKLQNILPEGREEFEVTSSPLWSRPPNELIHQRLNLVNKGLAVYNRIRNVRKFILRQDVDPDVDNENNQGSFRSSEG